MILLSIGRGVEVLGLWPVIDFKSSFQWQGVAGVCVCVCVSEYSLPLCRRTLMCR